VYKDGSLPVLFICAMKLQQWLPSLLQHVADISCHLSADESLATCRELLSFVPMSSLCGSFLCVFEHLKTCDRVSQIVSAHCRVRANVNFSRSFVSEACFVLQNKKCSQLHKSVWLAYEV